MYATDKELELRKIMNADRLHHRAAARTERHGSPPREVASVSPKLYAHWDFSLHYEPTIEEVEALIQSHGHAAAAARWLHTFRMVNRHPRRQRQQQGAAA
jgi:hypothetical protein